MRNHRTPWLKSVALTTLILTAAAGMTAASDFRPLIGRWQRTDGNYVIDIRSVSQNGTMDAGYFNPRSINVSRAEASDYKNHIKVEVELRDTGYPGSTYTLVYDPDKDALLGLYYQAIQKQNFEVVFVRME